VFKDEATGAHVNRPALHAGDFFAAATPVVDPWPPEEMHWSIWAFGKATGIPEFGYGQKTLWAMVQFFQDASNTVAADNDDGSLNFSQ
jgi:hypothetical protein